MNKRMTDVVCDVVEAIEKMNEAREFAGEYFPLYVAVMKNTKDEKQARSAVNWARFMAGEIAQDPPKRRAS